MMLRSRQTSPLAAHGIFTADKTLSGGELHLGLPRGGTLQQGRCPKVFPRVYGYC